MNLDKYIAKARPGAVGGKFEEKRPLRERVDIFLAARNQRELEVK